MVIAALALVWTLTSAPVAHAAPSEDGWRPFYKRDGVIYRWRTCTLTYKIAFNGESRSAAKPLRAAIRDVERVSGIDFVYKGAAPRTSKRQLRDPERLGVDVVIGMYWKVRNGWIAAAGAHSNNAERAFKYGRIEVHRKKIKRYSYTTRRHVYQHELGHVLGLGHVDRRSDVMYSKVHSGINTWGWRSGLRTLYRKCR